jgi:hypothetical protein
MKIVCGVFKKGGVQYDVDGDLPEPCSDAQATARGQIEGHFLPTSHEQKRMIKSIKSATYFIS